MDLKWKLQFDDLQPTVASFEQGPWGNTFTISPKAICFVLKSPATEAETTHRWLSTSVNVSMYEPFQNPGFSSQWDFHRCLKSDNTSPGGPHALKCVRGVKRRVPPPLKLTASNQQHQHYDQIKTAKAVKLCWPTTIKRKLRSDQWQIDSNLLFLSITCKSFKGQWAVSHFRLRLK